MAAATLRRLGLAVALAAGLCAATSSGAIAAPLQGIVDVNAHGPTVHGYRTLLNLRVGSKTGDFAQITLTRKTGTISQSHAWSTSLAAGDITLDRATASVRVHHSLGTRGAIDATFTGGPRRHKLSTCGSAHTVVDGRLTGRIRLAVGDRFFRTITIRRMTGSALDDADAPGCRAPCPRRHDLVQGTLPYDVRRPNVSFGAEERASRLGPPRVYVSVFDPVAGTPFTSVVHVLEAAGPKRLLRTNAALTRADVQAPGGALSGHLRFASSGPLRRIGATRCGGASHEMAERPAQVVSGRITAAFDSIGTYRVAKNLNGGFPHSTIARTHLAREY